MVSETRINWSVISLTNRGRHLAELIVEKFPANITHVHKPTPFAETVQELFSQRRGLIFICATGIVMRSLASVLIDKYQDPPVLVLDEEGRFVIPLLSGHEGQANRWATKVAALINAQTVITTADYYTSTAYVAGMGCIRGCSKDILRKLVFENLHRLQLDPKNLLAISSISVKADEIGLIKLAQELAIPFVVYDASQLRQVEDRLQHKSEYVFSEVGCYGVSESAALLHADILSKKQSLMLMPKVNNAQATLSFAEVCRLTLKK